MIHVLLIILIYVLIPICGVFWYLKVLAGIKKDKVENPPTLDLFFVFFLYGILLLLVLSDLFLRWSGMSTLGLLFSITFSPIIMGFIAIRNYKKRAYSKYHKYSWQMGVLYYILLGILIWLYSYQI